MYKVFIGDKVINFVEIANELYDPETVFHEPAMKDIQSLLFKIFYDKKYCDFYFVSDNAEKLFIAFYSKMHIITAAGGVIINEQNQILFIFRRGHWDLPKGKIDYDETAEDAALREVKEETGIKNVEILKRLNSVFHVYTIGDEWILKETHWFLIKSNIFESFTPQLDEGITEIKWKNRNAFLDIKNNAFKSLHEIILNVYDTILV